MIWLSEELAWRCAHSPSTEPRSRQQSLPDLSRDALGHFIEVMNGIEPQHGVNVALRATPRQSGQ